MSNLCGYFVRLALAAFVLNGLSAFAQTTIFSDGFEGAFPGSWVVGNDGGITTHKWGDNSAKKYTGGWSVFCADNGNNSANTYPNSLHTTMDQSVSLIGYNSATLTFRCYCNTEANYDKLTVNVKSGGTWSSPLRTLSGNSGGWQLYTVNLDAYAGLSITLQLRFDSDSTTTGEGVWVDDVLVAGTPAGALSVTVKDANGSVFTGSAAVSRYNASFAFLDSKSTASGVASWPNVPTGTYNLEAYSNGEFWGAAQATVTQNNTANVTIQRTEPWATAFVTKLGSTDITGGTVLAESTLSHEVTVKNSTAASQSVRVLLRIDQSQSSPFDFEQTSPSQTISSGGTKSFSFNHTPSTSGIYYRYLEVQTYVNNAWVKTDTYDWGEPLTVTAQHSPTITKVSPSGDVAISMDQSIDFQTSCADQDGNLQNVNWYVDGVLDHSTSISGSSASDSWNRAFSTAGTFNIGAQVVDTTGRSSELAWIVTVNPIEGIDVSHYQGTISWSEVTNTGHKSFAFIKASEATDTPDGNDNAQDHFLENIQGAKGVNILASPYHLARPDRGTSAIAEAQYFLSRAGSFIRDGYLPPALDLEGMYGLTGAQLSIWVRTWLRYVHDNTSVHVIPIIYTTRSVLLNLDSDLQLYPLWIATNDDDKTGTPSYLGTSWPNWKFKQYKYGRDLVTSAVLGTCPGVPGDGACDLDSFHGNLTELSAQVIGNASSKIITLNGTLNFGDVMVGSSSSLQLSLVNDGKAPLAVGSVNYPNGFTGSWSSGTIASGQSVRITVTFSPGALGAYAANITFNSDATSGISCIPVSGAGVNVQPITYTVTPSASANGSIDPNTAQAVNSSGALSLAATPAPGYVVEKWFVNNVVAQTSGEIFTITNVTAAASVQVTFAPVPQPKQLTDMTVSNGEFRFVLNGVEGTTCLIQKSLDLVDWTTISTNTIPVGGSINVTNPASGQVIQFYRAVMLN
jgi:GH25 family lysozyme M1 (1,4-beta-N-acetylmuramidase)